MYFHILLLPLKPTTDRRPISVLYIPLCYFLIPLLSPPPSLSIGPLLIQSDIILYIYPGSRGAYIQRPALSIP